MDTAKPELKTGKNSGDTITVDLVDMTDIEHSRTHAQENIEFIQSLITRVSSLEESMAGMRPALERDSGLTCMIEATVRQTNLIALNSTVEAVLN